MSYATVVIVGAGQSGLAASHHLSRHGIDHVVLERGEVANAWLRDRWDTLRLLTPNWQTRLPGHRYAGDDPDGFMDAREVARFLQGYALHSAAPVVTGAPVTRVEARGAGYRVHTAAGEWTCRMLLIASGACSKALRPAMGDTLPAGMADLDLLSYRHPGQLPPGGVLVVGASASGVQLAREIHESGRPVLLCVGEHLRVPRRYRGRDIMRWMDGMGMMDVRYDAVDDIARARRPPSLQLAGTDAQRMLDLNVLQAMGVEVAGRLVCLREGAAWFSGSLAHHCAMADLKMDRLLGRIDDWIARQGLEGHVPGPERFAPTRLCAEPATRIDLARKGIRSVLWATGYRPDYAWLDLPVLDARGRLRHDGGIVAAPGVYAMGLPFMRRRKSSFIDGADQDAADLVAHMRMRLAKSAA